MKSKVLLFGLLVALSITSCSKNEEPVAETTFTLEEASVNAKFDIMNDDVSKVVEEQLTPDEGITGRSTASAASFLPTCAQVTRVPDFGTIPAVGDVIIKTIDFGTTGCPLPNGNVLKGKIIITFVYQPNATSHTINYEFVNFFHNAIKIVGNKNFTRTLSAATAASPSHPIVTMNLNMTITLPDGRIFTRIGTRVREIIEGYSTVMLSDNVYKITGNWTTTFPNSSIQTSTITQPLIVKLNCNNITKGVVTFVRNTNIATLDYGDGSCDNQAIFTINGVPRTITLN
jgi:hypothetical protein